MKEQRQSSLLAQRRVAIVHDFLVYPGGAEKVLGDLLALFPHAPVFTLLYDKDGMAPMASMLHGRRIYTSFLQKFPRWCRRHMQWLIPLMPTAPEVFDLRNYDVVISSSGAWSKGIVTRVSTVHVAYIHSPMRFVWDENVRYATARTKKRPGFFMRALFSYLRVWDFEAAQRPDVLVANSCYTQQRIAKFYRRDATVVYPAIAPIIHKTKLKRREHFLIVARLSEYKQVQLAVDVCTRLQLPLVVIGAGRMYDVLRKRAGATVRILGWQPDDVLARYYATARALLFPAEEDFGLVIAEALSYGTPVIAYGRGGALEMVEPGITGELFYAQTQEVLADGIRRFLEKEAAGGYDRDAMHTKAQAFNVRAFHDGILDTIEKAIAQHEATKITII